MAAASVYIPVNWFSLNVCVTSNKLLSLYHVCFLFVKKDGTKSVSCVTSHVQMQGCYIFTMNFEAKYTNIKQLNHQMNMWEMCFCCAIKRLATYLEVWCSPGCSIVIVLVSLIVAFFA